MPPELEELLRAQMAQGRPATCGARRRRGREAQAPSDAAVEDAPKPKARTTRSRTTKAPAADAAVPWRRPPREPSTTAPAAKPRTTRRRTAGVGDHR